MQNKIFQTIVKITLVSFVFGISFFWAQTSLAGMTPLSVMSATFERLKVNEFSNQTIQFTTTTGVINGDMMEIDYPAGEFTGFGKVGLGEDDVEVKNITTNHVYTDAGGPGCGGPEEIYVNVGADVIRLFFCPGNGGSAAAGDQIRVYVGAFTTETVEDGNFKLLNPVAAGSKKISLYTGPFGIGLNYERGALEVSIVDDDQVLITATIDPTLVFDLDTAVADAESGAPYAVNLGTLTPGAVASSGAVIKSIWVDLSTNATGGAVVTVGDVGNGAAAGLYSATVAKNITSGTVTVTAGTEGYGVCVMTATAGSGTFQAVAPYNTAANCTTANHDVGALNLVAAAANILDSNSLPLTAGRARILVKAAISSTTPAAADYTDQYTFIATGTF